jgi:hypothetical protein
VNGQIQYGSARPLTLRRTLRRDADPARFGVRRTRRRIAMAAGGCLLLVLVQVTNLAGLPAAITLAIAWIPLVLAMTLPSRPELAGRELTHRLAQFRHELNAIGDAPGRLALERLIARVAELGLREDEVSDELAQLRASLDALDLKESLAQGELPFAETPDFVAPGEACHFVCAVRFGRRRADQFGHLVMSPARLEFRGVVDVSAAWSDIASVRRAGRELLIVLREKERVLRFSCQSHADAARGGVIADHLAGLARPESSLRSAEYHLPA